VDGHGGAVGGRYLARTPKAEKSRFTRAQGIMVIVEWPSREVALHFMIAKSIGPTAKAALLAQNEFCL